MHSRSRAHSHGTATSRVTAHWRATAHATWRETRDPLLRILADRVGARVQAMKVELPAKQGWRLLAMRNTQWSGNALDPQLLLAKEPPEPDLLGIALAPKFDQKTAAAAAERMVTDKLVWTSKEQRWSPGQIVRSSWAIQLAGGKPADDYRKIVYMAAIPSRLDLRSRYASSSAPR